MSQRDVVAELHLARVEAPAELRARIRLIAAAAEPPRRRVTWRRAFVVAIPVAAALAAGIVALTRPSHHTAATPLADQVQHGTAATLAPNSAKRKAFSVPAPTARATIYDETLALELPSARAVSDGVKRALSITTSLSGYATSVHASTGGRQATAELVLEIPRGNVQQAVSRLSQLGTIVSEHVDLKDAQAGLNVTDRTIARLQRRLTALRAQEPLPAKQIAQLESRIAALQRGEAATRLKAHYATVSLQLATKAPAVAGPHHHGRLHGVGVALTWLGVGAVYALAIGGPVIVLVALVWLAARLVRRRREEALLSRP